MPRSRGLHEGGKDDFRRGIIVRPYQDRPTPQFYKHQENKRMKITRNKSSLQDQLAKMLQAGKENVDNSTDNESVEQSLQTAPLHANTQASTARIEPEYTQEKDETPIAQQQVPQQVTSEDLPQEEDAPEAEAAVPRSYRPRTAPARPRSRKAEEAPRLNASQRHEVPDRNAKFAGEPIKSVGCRMPQSLYARMLQYKALNDTQLNRITLNDIIIEAVDKYLSKIK